MTIYSLYAVNPRQKIKFSEGDFLSIDDRIEKGILNAKARTTQPAQ